jgi:hypothetical protein
VFGGRRADADEGESHQISTVTPNLRAMIGMLLDSAIDREQWRTQISQSKGEQSKPLLELTTTRRVPDRTATSTTVVIFTCKPPRAEDRA